MEAVTGTGRLTASPDALQRSARCPPQRVPSSGGAVGASHGSKRGRRVKTIVTVWTCHGARAWPRVPDALQPLSSHSAPALWSQRDLNKMQVRAELFCVFLLPRGRHGVGEHRLLTGAKDGVFATCSLKLLSTILCRHIYCGRRRHWDRAPRLAASSSDACWKTLLGGVEDTGQSTTSVGVGTSWRGLKIHVQMPVSRSQVPLFLEKVWKRRELSSSLGALPPLSEFALPGEVRIHVEMPVSRWGWGHVNRLGISQVKAES